MGNIIQKIWASSPKAVYQKICYIFKVPQKNTIEKIKILSGIIKNANLSMFSKKSKAGIAMFEGKYEPYLVDELLKRIDVTGKIIWDVGAYIGYHSLSFAKIVGKDGKVVAFEPNPNNFDLLNKNIKDNLNIGAQITAIPEALSNKIGKQGMEISQNKYQASSTGGYLNNIAPPLAKHHYANFIKIQINTTTVDEVIKSKHLDTPDIIKIDIEGGEYNLILGAQDLLKTKKPILIIEVHSIPQMFYIQTELIKYGYTMEIIDEHSSTITKNIIAR